MYAGAIMISKSTSADAHRTLHIAAVVGGRRCHWQVRRKSITGVSVIYGC